MPFQSYCIKKLVSDGFCTQDLNCKFEALSHFFLLFLQWGHVWRAFIGTSCRMPIHPIILKRGWCYDNLHGIVEIKIWENVESLLLRILLMFCVLRQGCEHTFQCQWSSSWWPSLTSCTCGSWHWGIHREHRLSSECERQTDHSGYTKCESCCGVCQTNWFP